MKNGVPVVSIVIPCRNEAEHIGTCVRSLLTQDFPAAQFEVIVADGMSEDGTRDVARRLAQEDARVTMVENQGRIVSTGLNAAIGAARGRIIIRADAHTEYAPDYVSQCVAVLRETGADNVGGPWVAKGKGLMGRAIAAAFQSSFAVGGARGHDANYEGSLDTVYLGCWPREVFDRIGLFDEELVRNQDDEFNLRLARAGGKIWQSPRIRSWYSPRGSLGELLRQQMQYGYWKVRVIQKHRMPASVRHLIPALFVISMFLLPVLSPWWALAGWTWLALAGTYSIFNIAASTMAAARHGWELLPLLPPVFVCYHFGYGWGFLRGIWDFAIVRRRPGFSQTKLTRRLDASRG
jgi:succinoglycan biosynthesis protein ExoA